MSTRSWVDPDAGRLASQYAASAFVGSLALGIVLPGLSFNLSENLGLFVLCFFTFREYCIAPLLSLAGFQRVFIPGFLLSRNVVQTGLATGLATLVTLAKQHAQLDAETLRDGVARPPPKYQQFSISMMQVAAIAQVMLNAVFKFMGTLDANSVADVVGPTVDRKLGTGVILKCCAAAYVVMVLFSLAINQLATGLTLGLLTPVLVFMFFTTRNTIVSLIPEPTATSNAKRMAGVFESTWAGAFAGCVMALCLQKINAFLVRVQPDTQPNNIQAYTFALSGGQVCAGLQFVYNMWWRWRSLKS